MVITSLHEHSALEVDNFMRYINLLTYWDHLTMKAEAHMCVNKKKINSSCYKNIAYELVMQCNAINLTEL